MKNDSEKRFQKKMRLEKMVKDLERCQRKYQLKEEQFGRQLKAFKERCSDLELIEKGVQEQLEKIKREEGEIVQRCRDIELSGNCLKKDLEDLESKSAQCEKRFREIKLMEESVTTQFEKLKEKEEHFRSNTNQFEGFSRDSTMQERNLEMGNQDRQDKRYEDLEQRYRELEIKEKHYAECLRKVELREKKLVEWSNQHESKSLPLALQIQVDHSSPGHLRFCVNMDGKDLQMFLNERWKEHGSIGTEVAMVLQLAADPAMLVLDAMEGFYPPHLSKEDRECDVNVARRSCIILLEQLMKLSPQVKPHVKGKAMKLAFCWITKMRPESGHELEVLGFLLLLASFQLADAFDADELVNYLGVVAQQIQTPELFKLLGLGDKITGFIRKLIEKKQHLVAIRYIYAFQKLNEFPPVPLLKDFLSHSDAEAAKMGPKTQNQASKRIAELRGVVNCIEDNNLESEYHPYNLQSLKNLIVALEKVNGSRNLTSPEAAKPSLCTSSVSET